MSFSPRRVRFAPSVALYECRLVRCDAKAASLLRYVESRVKRWRGVQRWAALCFKSGRGEVVVQVVAERATPALRIDNLLHAWRKLIAKILPDGVSAKQLKRGGWFADAFVDIKIMAEAFDAGIGKLRAEAAAVDSAALSCSFVEPALPSESRAAPSAISEQPRPSAPATSAITGSTASRTVVAVAEPARQATSGKPLASSVGQSTTRGAAYAPASRVSANAAPERENENASSTTPVPVAAGGARGAIVVQLDR